MLKPFVRFWMACILFEDMRLIFILVEKHKNLLQNMLFYCITKKKKGGFVDDSGTISTYQKGSDCCF
jgi:hypothetical protein